MNVFMKESRFFLYAEGDINENNELAVVCTFPKPSVGIQAKGLQNKKTPECQSVYTWEGGSLCSIASTPMDMEKMWHRGYAIAV